ncbi:CMD domain protein [Paracraurococcus ruber]|uniref:CMD domain protein n=1 Tax=Paracraurococcus ruber TaxID=77675 RepID=A0ABS1CSP1_9PROT|nr:CMD domain protein [Paracraurococcus ruber]MBK1657350.1 CMD domain protein [Paracraurococcus ruber]TDG34019.1 CMD domain protein [Paracraurococcus ruber]
MDLIDQLVGVAPGSALDAIRARRAVARAQSVESYRVLFTPAAPGEVSIAERFAVGAYVAGLHGPSPTAEHYMAELQAQAPALADAVAQAIAATAGTGPYGSFPAGPLSAEDAPGAEAALSPALAEALGPRLTAALAHAHFLLFHPRDAAPERFAPLLAAGWSTTGIVTLSQIVSFLAYQIRVVAGLRVLAGNLAEGLA